MVVERGSRCSTATATAGEVAELIAGAGITAVGSCASVVSTAPVIAAAISAAVTITAVAVTIAAVAIAIVAVTAAVVAVSTVAVAVSTATATAATVIIAFFVIRHRDGKHGNETQCRWLQGETLGSLVGVKHDSVVIVLADADTQGASDIGDVGSAVEDTGIQVIGRHRVACGIQHNRDYDREVGAAYTNRRVFGLHAVGRGILFADAASDGSETTLDKTHGGRITAWILLVAVGNDLELGVLL